MDSNDHHSAVLFSPALCAIPDGNYEHNDNVSKPTPLQIYWVVSHAQVLHRLSSQSELKSSEYH